MIKMRDVRGDFVLDNNKVGIFVTNGIDRPHSTVMAYLSTKDDDIFIISHKGSFKSNNIIRNRDCAFTIDHRPELSFERAVFWNYTALKGRIYNISRSNPLFSFIQKSFVEKNPWEMVFFTHDDIEMFHIQSRDIICPEKYGHLLSKTG